MQCLAECEVTECILTNVTSITIPSTVEINGEDCSVTSIGQESFYYISNVKIPSITIPNTVKSIAREAFAGCKVDNIIIEENSQLTTIGYEAFDFCWMTSFEVPKSVTSIGDRAFCSCESMLTLTFEENSQLTSIGSYAFQACCGLTSIEIPSSVTSIGKAIISSLSPNNMTTVIVAKGNTKYDSRNNCNAIIETATNTLIQGCKNTIIPNTVTSIGEYAFYDLDGEFTSIEIPNSVTSIGNYAFSRCVKLANIFCNGVTPATLGSDVFKNISSNAKIYVPSASLNEYKSQWSEYSDMIVGMSVYTEKGWSSEPISSDYVVIKYPLVIDKDEILSVDAVNVSNTGSVTIKDGGQLVCNNVNGNITIEKEIEGYADHDENSWHTIASPLKAPLTITSNSTLLTPHSNYDLYRYDEPTFTWENYKYDQNNFTALESGRGYLYANADDVTLEFTGAVNTEDVTYTLTTDGSELTGFHLIGNPFTHDIYMNQHIPTIVDEEQILVYGYYTLNGDGAWEANPMSEEDAIKPMQGILVKALQEGELTISRQQSAVSRQQSRNGSHLTSHSSLQINVANGKYSDRAFVVFDKGVGLDKINHQNENIPMLYIPVDGVDYAIAAMDKNFNEIPVSFEAMTMGEYTISLRQDNCEFEELYLLDKETNTTVNILAEDYTFIATSNENPERFMLLKKANGQQPTANSHFAYVNNSDIVIQDINGCADIKIFDAMGRCVYNGNCCTDTIHRVPMGGFSTGVYMIQKADENGVKVQKVIID